MTLRKLILNRAALRNNLACTRSYAPQSKVLAMLKADAYGHGLLFVAGALAKEAEAFGLAAIEEALLLRRAGITNTLVLMHGFLNEEMLRVATSEKLECVIHSLPQIDLLQTLPASSINIWLKINTGMNRLGIAPEEFFAAWKTLLNCPAVRCPIRLLTHFSKADILDDITTEQQIALTQQLIAQIPDAVSYELSLANSAALIAWPNSIADWVRPGLMLYGASPFADRSAASLGLLPVMTVKTKLIAIYDLPANAAIGYSGAYICKKPMRIGVLDFGYGDGYPRLAPLGTPVLWQNQRLPIIGRVSMDMMTVDLSSASQAKIGDDVTLWGDGLPIEEVAAAVGSSPYELFCHLKKHRMEIEEV